MESMTTFRWKVKYGDVKLKRVVTPPLGARSRLIFVRPTR
jgi:hypothetical protein